MIPAISIIVAIYNAEKYLDKCVQSILTQTKIELEIILVNDGSTDGSLDICKRYEELDNRVIVINKENGGVVSARKAGCYKASGEYIGFVDADDWVDNKMYEYLFTKAKKYNADVVNCNIIHNYASYEIKNPQSLKNGYYNEEEMKKELYPIMLFGKKYNEFGIYPSVCNKIYKKEIILSNIGLLDERITMGEDALLSYSCILDANSIYISKKYLYHYRQLEDTMSKKYDYIAGKRVIRLIKNLHKITHIKKSLDLKAQIPYYCAFMSSYVVSNESKRENHKSLYEKVICMNKYLNEPIIEKYMKKVNLKNIKGKHKLYVLCLKRKWSFLILALLDMKHTISSIKNR